MTEKHHSIFQPPKDPNTKVWRFMDFAKYFSLMSSGKLFFSRVDKLGDKYEGSLPIANQKLYTYADFGMWEKGSRMLQEINEESKRSMTRGIVRTWRYANCWFIDSKESYLMWQVYTQSKKHGVAIQSTYSKLQNIKQNFQRIRCKMHLGRVNYIDYTKDSIPNDPILPYMHKRHFYENEQEVRLLIEEKPKRRDKADIKFRYTSTIIENENNGIEVPIALNELIDAIYVSPDSEDWFLKLVQDVTMQYIPRFKIDEIQKSMSGRPSY